MLRRALRIVGWIVLGVVLFVAACVLVAVVWLRTDAGHRFVRAQVELRASRVIAGTVEIGAVSGSITRETVLHDVVVRAEDGATVAKIARVDVRYSVGELLGEPRRIARVVLERPVLHVDEVRALRSVSEKPPSRITVEELVIRDGRVLAPATELTVEDVDARARVAHGTANAATLRELTATLRRDGHTRPLTARGAARWSKDEVDIPGVELASGGSRLQLRGTAHRGGAAPTVALWLDADLAAADLRALTPLEPVEPVSLALRARGTPDDFVVDLRSNLPAALEVGRWPLYGHARLRRGDGQAAVAPLQLRAGGNRLDATLRMADGRKEVRLDALTIRPALARALLPIEPTETLRLAGRATLDGARAAANLRLRAGGGAAWLVAEQDQRTHALVAHLRTRSLSPHALAAAAPAGDLDATVAVDGVLGAAGHGVVQADLGGTLAKQPIRDAALRATWALGATERLRLVADAKVGSRRLRAHVDARRRGPVIRVPDAELEFGDSEVKLAGRWLPDRGARAHATARLRPDDVHVLVPSWRPRVDVELRLAASGPPRDVDVTLDARLGPGRARAAAQLDVPDRRARVRGELVDVDTALLGLGPRMRVSAALALDGGGDGDGITLDDVAVRDGRVIWSARNRRPASLESLTLRASAHLGVRGRVRLTELSGVWVAAHESRPLSGRGEARWDRDRRVYVDGAFAAGGSGLSIAGHLASAPTLAKQPLHLRTQLTLEPDLVAELLPRLRSDEPLRLALVARGPLGDLRLRASLSGVAGEAAAIDARLRLAHDDYRLRRLAVRFGNSRLQASGALRRDRLSAQLQLALAPDDAHRLVRALDPAGPLTLRATANGPPEAIDLRAVLHAGGGALHVGGRLDAPGRRGRVRFTADRLAPRAFIRTQPAGQLSAAASVVGRLARGGIVGTLRVGDLRGELRQIPFDDGAAQGRFAGKQLVVNRFSVDIPGADVYGHARIALGGALAATIGVHVNRAFQIPGPFVTDLVLGADQALVDGAVVTLKITKKKGQKLHRDIDLALPGERTMKKAWRGVTQGRRAVQAPPLTTP